MDRHQTSEGHGAPPHDAPGTGHPGGDGAPGRAARPPLRRPQEGRILAGVASGLADHLGLDVAIVRILIVVLTIVTSGLGAIVYLIAIFVIPAAEPGAPRPTPTPRSEVSGTGRDPLFWVGVSLLVVGALWLIGGPVSGAGLRAGGVLRELAIPAVLIAFGLALWRAGDRRPPGVGPAASTPPPPPATTPAPSPTTSPAATAAVATSATTTNVPPNVPTTPTTEPAMITDGPTQTEPRPPGNGPSSPPDPHDPFSGEATAPISRPGDGGTPPLPPDTGDAADEPGWTPPPVPPRRRSLLTRITLGTALTTTGVLWLLRAADVLAIDWGQIAAAALLVVGIGLLVGSIVGRARWLILVGVLVASFVLAWQVTTPWTGMGSLGSWVTSFDGRAGELRETPTSVAQLDAQYEVGAGSIHLDLTDLELDGETVETTVEVGAGQIRVRVPDDAEIEVSANSGIGQVNIFDRERSGGIGPGRHSVTHIPDDPEGRIELDLSAGLGEVRVDLVPADRP